jgi:hypothetical protein
MIIMLAEKKFNPETQCIICGGKETPNKIPIHNPPNKLGRLFGFEKPYFYCSLECLKEGQNLPWDKKEFIDLNARQYGIKMKIIQQISRTTGLKFEL